MKKFIVALLIAVLSLAVIPPSSWARGTRYFVNWPEGHIGPVFVQVYDIRYHFPFERLDNFKIWVTWGNQTKCYDIGNRGTYLLTLYKDQYCKGPMIISGNVASFRIRYSMVPPWI